MPSLLLLVLSDYVKKTVNTGVIFYVILASKQKILLIGKLSMI